MTGGGAGTPAVPPTFDAFRARGPEWADWLDGLPRLARDLVADWDLAVDGEATHGENALVLPVRTAEGRAAALKVTFPHEEAEHEHLALRHWAGDGAVELLRADPHRWALLLERVGPADLTTVDDDASCRVVGGLYRRLHRPAPPQLRRLSALAALWGEQLRALPRDAPAPRRLVEQAAALCRTFADDDATDGRLLHGDLHVLNVLAAQREPWVVVDPGPLSGDPAFEVAPMLWNRWAEVVATRDVRGAVNRRLDVVVEVAVLDRDRVRDWVVVRELVNVLWALQDAERLGRGLLPAEREWVTRAVTVAKAVQP